MGKTLHIELEKISTQGLQTRAAMNMETVREYADAERETGAVFPPVTVFLGADGVYRLADGFHRLAMARQQGRRTIAAEVRKGGFEEALKYALLANVAHGMRRTSADKRNSVMVAYKYRRELGLGEVPSARAVAEMVGVSNHFAGLQLGTVPSWRCADERNGADGKTRSLPPPARKSGGEERGPRPEDGGLMAEAAPGCGTNAAPGCGTMRTSFFEYEKSECALPAPAVLLQSGPPPVRRSAAAAPQGPVDGRGREIPPDLLPVWNRRGEVRELVNMVSRIRTALRDAQEGNDPLWLEANFSSALAHADRLHTELKSVEPYCVCPMCQGIGCETCKGRGLLGEWRYDRVVPESVKKCASSSVR